MMHRLILQIPARIISLFWYLHADSYMLQSSESLTDKTKKWNMPTCYGKDTKQSQVYMYKGTLSRDYKSWNNRKMVTCFTKRDLL